MVGLSGVVVNSSLILLVFIQRARKEGLAIKEAIKKASPVLLEPIMAVEVVTPEEYLGEVMGDLNSRRGRVAGMEARGGAQVVSAQVRKSLDIAVRVYNHQMDVQGLFGMPADGFDHWHSIGNVGDKDPIHHIDVVPGCLAVIHHFHVSLEVPEVRG